MSYRKKICLIVSSPITIKVFLLNHLIALSKIYDVTIIANDADDQLKEIIKDDIKIISLPIDRNITLLNDALVLIKLIGILKKEKFDLIHSVTPKAGLFSVLAGKIASTPIRIHTFTGQVWASRNGIVRVLLKSADKTIALLSTNILADSNSQMQYLIKEKIVSPDKISVLANGSISGVNTNKFVPNLQIRESLRNQLGITNAGVVFLFIGRLKRDKGVLDLCLAFKEKFNDEDNAYLLLVGPDEERLSGAIDQLNIKKDKLCIVPYTDEPEKFMAAADVLCLPSYREGFGSVIIEAAACGLPAIGSRIYGVIDAISENESGLLHIPGDIKALVRLMQVLYADSDKRINIGKAARIRVERLFSAERVTAAWLDYYASVI
jgi:glycosyltransferase involved in cell wall biosynthesis